MPKDAEAAQLEALDAAGARAALALDAAAMEALYSPDALLHFAPARRLMTTEDMLDEMRAPRFRYLSFERTTEHVAVRGDIAVTVGRETVAPEGDHPQTGSTLRRRYTHVWRREDGRWRLLVRHVNADG
jgi:ketosteroid isomerase-like protein